MTLPFSTQLNGEPTYFVDKIWRSFYYNRFIDYDLDFTFFNQMYVNKFSKVICQLPTINIKRHSIREDKTNRWKAGNNIHFVINNRTPQRFQFAPVIKCVSIQKIEIKYYVKNNANKVSVKVEGKEVNLNDLAANDGFQSPGEFLDYFNKDFTGKIIHWTNLKY